MKRNSYFEVAILSKNLNISELENGRRAPSVLIQVKPDVERLLIKSW